MMRCSKVNMMWTNKDICILSFESALAFNVFFFGMFELGRELGVWNCFAFLDGFKNLDN